MVQHDHQVVRVAIAASALADRANAGVVAFERGVGQVMPDPGQDAGQMRLNRLPEALERAQPLPAQHATPNDQQRAHLELVDGAPDRVELLFEQVGLLQATVEPQKDIEVAAAAPVETSAFPQEQELLAADDVAIASAPPPELGLAHLVYGFGEVALD